MNGGYDWTESGCVREELPAKSGVRRLFSPCLPCLPGFIFLLLATPAFAQETRTPEALTAWPFYDEVEPAGPGPARYIEFLVTPKVFDKARADLADLRLRDARNQEVPYALRIRRTENRQAEVKHTVFNHARLPDGADQMILDLGEKLPTCNEMVVTTTGSNFRRRAQVEGSDNGKDWNVIVAHAELIDFPPHVDIRRITFPTSKFRYLRLRVYPDGSKKQDQPTIKQTTVLQATRIEGRYKTLAATLDPRQPVKTPQGPGSAWIIDLGGANVPVEKLSFDVADDDFVRDYRLEIMPESEQDPQADSRRHRFDPKMEGPYRPEEEDWYRQNLPFRRAGEVASGRWQRRAGEKPEPMTIEFPEVSAHRLRLVVTDFSNPPLRITSVSFTAAAREIVFARSGDLAQPLRLYFGNLKAHAPNYDFARNLPANLVPAPDHTALAPEIKNNPDYRPEPKPWTERWPWAIYLVLGLASLVLLGILGLLAREAVARHDAASADRTEVGSPS